MQLFCLQLEASCLQWSFFLTVDILAFLLRVWAFLLTALASSLTVGALFAYNGKVLPIRALRDCKQRSLTVSKKAPTVSKKASPPKKGHPDWRVRDTPFYCTPFCGTPSHFQLWIAGLREQTPRLCNTSALVRQTLCNFELQIWLANITLWVSQRPLTLILLQKDRNTNWRRIVIQIGGVSWYKLVVYILLSAKRRAYCCKSTAIEIWEVYRDTFQKYRCHGSIRLSWSIIQWLHHIMPKTLVSKAIHIMRGGDVSWSSP